MVPSPLNKFSTVSCVETIKTLDLVKLYKKKLNVDILSEFQKIQEIGLYHCQESDLYFFYPTIVGSERFYEHMQQFDWYYLDDKQEYEYASNFIGESDSVLEVGCGKGAFSTKILTEKYTGIEFSHKAAQIAKEQGVKVINESIQEHVIKHRGAYDVVCSFQVLEHVDNINSFIQSSLDCLKTDGLMILSVPSFDSFSKYLSNLSLDMPPHHVTRWTDKALTNITNYFDIELVEIIHEPLQMIHRHMYIKSLLKKSFIATSKGKFKNIDFSWQDLTISLISKILSQVFVHGLDEPIMLPRGISVVAIYRKIGDKLPQQDTE